MSVADKEEFLAANAVIECRVFEFEFERIDRDAENIGLKINTNVRHLCNELRFYIVVENTAAVDDEREKHGYSASPCG